MLLGVMGSGPMSRLCRDVGFRHALRLTGFLGRRFRQGRPLKAKSPRRSPWEHAAQQGSGSSTSRLGDSQTSQRPEVDTLTDLVYLHFIPTTKIEGPTGHLHVCVLDGPLAFDDSVLTNLEDLNGRRTSLLSPPNCQGKTQKAKAKHV